MIKNQEEFLIIFLTLYVIIELIVFLLQIPDFLQDFILVFFFLLHQKPLRYFIMLKSALVTFDYSTSVQNTR